jgi:hypothetical protein
MSDVKNATNSSLKAS